MIEKIFMLSLVIEAFKKLVTGMFLLYTFCKLIVLYITTGLLKSLAQLISQTRWDLPCANSSDQDLEFT